jgi:tetratricopeptide (TPR) repeat protein/transcriptional regulator with XRE-family HTH domain
MDLTPPPTFGAWLRRCRRAAGLTQEELAERAAVSVRSIRDLERGVSRRPHRDTVALLAAALDLPAAEHPAFAEAARQVGRASPLPTAAGEPAPPFVGRGGELALLERHLAGGGPPLLLLAGEPGIGKSRLLQAALPRAVALGFCVLEGGCQRRGGQDPYAPLTDALQRHIRRQHPAQLRTTLEGCAWLVRLLPELAEGPIPPLPGWTVSPEQEQRLVVEAVARYLAKVAGAGGTLLVLDDLQWAGADALEALATLTRSSAQVPLRVVGAYRDTEVPASDALAVLLADLAHAGLVAQRALHPLAPGEAAELLEGLLAGVEEPGAGLREQVLQRTGGVPYFLVSCTQALRLGTATQEDAVPWDVAQSVRQRVAVLPESAREVLGVAAVVGRVVPYALLAALVAQPEGGVLAAVEAACRTRLLEEHEEDAYRFPHDVIREVIEADLGAARRTALHRHIGAVLEQQGDALGAAPAVEILAYHYAHGGVQDKAVLYLERAGDQARARAAPAMAAEYYTDAMQRLDRLGRVLDSARIAEKLGTVLHTVARFDAALAVLEQAGQQYADAGDMEGVARVTAHMGWTHGHNGSAEVGIARLEPLLLSLEARGPTPGLAALYIALARLCAATQRTGEELAVSARAVELARTIGQDPLLAQALGRRGLALQHGSQIEAGRLALEEAGRLAAATGDLWTLTRANSSAANNGYTFRGEFAASRRCLVRAAKAAEQLGDPTQIAATTSARGLIAFYEGAWSQARDDLEQAVAMCRRIGPCWMFREALANMGRLYLALGAWDEASRVLEEAVTQAEQGHGVPREHSLLAECELLLGRAAAARARLVRLLEGVHPDYMDVPFILARLAWAELDLGEISRAADTVAQASAASRARTNRLALLDALWVQGRLAARAEAWEEAERALAEGVALARGMPFPYAEARLLHVAGAMLAQKGEREPAQERLASALAIFRQLGARKDMERAECDLAMLHPTSQA